MVLTYKKFDTWKLPGVFQYFIVFIKMMLWQIVVHKTQECNFLQLLQQ